MNSIEFIKLINDLRSLPKETEWVEFKVNNYQPKLIGECISALSNSACLSDRPKAYLVFGIRDETHKIKGTTFNPKREKVGNEELENWLVRFLNPRIDFTIYQDNIEDRNIVLFVIDPTLNCPVKFNGVSYIRVGSYKKKLKDFPEKERKIWNKKPYNLFEQEIATENIPADEVLKLLSYPDYFKLINLNLPDNKEGILEKLLQDKFILKSGTKYNITNLGAILFANHLEDFIHLQRKAPRVIIYSGKDRLNTVKEKEETKGYAIGFEGLVE